MSKFNGDPVCYLQINTGRWCQESYETASRHAAKRAKVLRAAGYRVAVQALGTQVTNVGAVKMTLVDVQPGTNADTFGIPPVRVERV